MTARRSYHRRATPRRTAFVPLEEPGQVAEAAPLDERDLRRGDDPQLPARSRLPAGAAAIRRRLYRDARAGGAHAADPDGPRRRRCRDHRQGPRAIHGPAGLDLGAEGPERSRRRSWPRSSRCDTTAPGGSSRSGPARSTTAPAPAPKPGSHSGVGSLRMLIKNDFTVPRSVDDVWAYLLDVEKVAPCMPGAELTETVDDRNWKGKLNMKFGPVAMSFAGTVALEERDDAAHRVKLHAKGTSRRARARRTPRSRSWMEPGDDGTQVSMEADITSPAPRRSCRAVCCPRSPAPDGRSSPSACGPTRRSQRGRRTGRRSASPPRCRQTRRRDRPWPCRDLVEHRGLLQAPVRREEGGEAPS